MMRLRIGKFWGRGSVPGGVLREKQMLGGEPILEAPVLARIVHVDAAAEHRDRAARPLEGRLVSRGVHAPREPRDHHDAGRRELAGELPGDVAAVARGIPRPDDRHRRQPQPLDPPDRVEEKRRVGDLCQRMGILGVEGRQNPDSRTLDPGGPQQSLGIVRPAQHGSRQILRFEFLRELVLGRGQERFDASPRAQHRPEPLGGDRTPPGPGEGRTSRDQTRAHRFNVLLMERGSTIPALRTDRKLIIPTRRVARGEGVA